jgi:hypothetical protein
MSIPFIEEDELRLELRPLIRLSDGTVLAEDRALMDLHPSCAASAIGEISRG